MPTLCLSIHRFTFENSFVSGMKTAGKAKRAE